MRERYDIAAITNDIYTKWDAEFLVRSGSLTPDRIAGVETGGCPHTAIREDASMNLAAVADMRAKFPDLDLVLIESGGDNLAATFSPELADLTIYVIDVAAGDKIPSKGGPGITRSDLLVINKIDLAPHVGASLEKMDTDARRMRGERPFVMTNLKKSEGLDRIIGFIETKGGLRLRTRPGRTSHGSGGVRISSSKPNVNGRRHAAKFCRIQPEPNRRWRLSTSVPPESSVMAAVDNCYLLPTLSCVLMIAPSYSSAVGLSCYCHLLLRRRTPRCSVVYFANTVTPE